MAENNNIDNTKNTAKAINFLKQFRPDGYHNLVSIDPNTDEVRGITRKIGHPDLTAFIERNNGRNNLYYSVNDPKPDAPDDKLKKHHIKSINAVWLDADPKKDKPFEQEKQRLQDLTTQLKTGENPPTYITDSGGGIQAFWLFEKPIEATPDQITHAESLSRGLAEQYGTDYVQNVDRIMRVPFTVNIPNKLKRDKGRKETTAKIIHADSPKGKRYADMPFITPSTKAESETNFAHTEVDMEAIKQPLPEELLQRLKDTLNRDKKAHDLYYGLIEKPSRSEYDFTLTQQLVWDNYSIQEVAHILYGYTHGKGKDLTKREIIRTYNRIDNPFEGLDAEYIDAIAKQVNPILAARKEGKRHPEDLSKDKSRYASISLHEMDWRKSGAAIYKNFLYESAITVIYGQSNVGKSFVAADIAGHIALGRDWGTFKFKSKKPIHILYIAAEAAGSFGKRGRALLKRMGVDKLPFKVIKHPLKFVKDQEDAKGVVAEIERLKREEDIEIGLVVVDTLATTFEGGNENSSEDMGMYISNMKYIQHFGNTGVLIVHHSGKDQAAGARGHSSLRAATDTEIEVMSEKKGERYYRQIKTRKQREGESDLTIRFGLMVVELGQDDEGDTIDTCHVVLENDTEFESIVPSPDADLDAGELAVKRASEYYEQIENVSKYKMSEMQLKALLHRDIKERLGVLVKNDGSLSLTELPFMTKPQHNDTTLKAYARDRKKLDEKNAMSGLDF